jgi:hypothetical protein
LAGEKKLIKLPLPHHQAEGSRSILRTTCDLPCPQTESGVSDTKNGRPRYVTPKLTAQVFLVKHSGIVKELGLTLSVAEPTAADVATAKAKEAEEQAALPYKWTQTIGDLDISITVPGNLRGKDLVVDIQKNKIKAGVKGQEPKLEVCIDPVCGPPSQC